MPKLADWPNEIISKVAPFIYTGLDSVAPFTSNIIKRRSFGSVYLHVRVVHLGIVEILQILSSLAAHFNLN